MALMAAIIAASPATSLGAKGPGPPADYTKIKGLSKPRFDRIVKEVRRVTVSDGTEIYLEITRPKRDRRNPVILEASPYHGTLADREGTRIFPGPEKNGEPIGLTGYFAPRGYAVVMMDLRGTGRSRGCLDHIGPNDRRDMKEIIEWAASRGWSNGRVGMTGHSYVGGTPSASAAMRPRGLKTIVPSAGLGSMYDHQFQAGVPYFLQWVGPMEAYEELALQRKLPPFEDPIGLGLGEFGDDFGNNPEDTGCGLPQSSLVAGEDQLSGRYAPWHADRDWRDAATRSRIPIFMVHGVNDDAARVDSIQWFTARGNRRFVRRGDKLWLGQWDHGSGCCPNRRGVQWTKALHAWFDRHLARRDVRTGPPVELFLADGDFEEVKAGARTEVLTRRAWPGRSRALALHPTGGGGLANASPNAGEVSFAGDPLGFVDNFASGGATFSTEPATRGVVLAGVPRLRLAASVTGPRTYLIGTLFDSFVRDGETVNRRITQCAIQPELRNSEDMYAPDRRDPVVPGERYTMKPPCFAMAHHLRKGHRLTFRVTTSDPDKVPVFSVDPNVTVYTGPGGTQLKLPVARRPRRLYPDRVPLEPGAPAKPGPAQPGFRGASTPLAPGAGARVEGVTSDYFEFEVKPGFDNARMVVEAVPASPADIDLYLQRREAGGFGDDLEAGESASLESETLTADRLRPGRYRVEAHLWAGGPSTRVDLLITFYNSKDEPGGPG